MPALLATVLLVLCALVMPAGARPMPALVDSEGNERAVRVFLDCDRCDFDVFRTDLPYVDYVIDRQDGDVHALVTRARTGAGESWQFELIGVGAFEGLDFEVETNTSQTDTDREVQTALVDTLQLGLVPYLLKTEVASQLSVRYSGPIGGAQQQAQTQAEDDPWNLWVYRMGASANLSGEDRRRSERFDVFGVASRTTERWRTSIGLFADSQTSRFTFDDGETFTNDLNGAQLSGRVVKSLGSKWGAAVGASARESVFFNLEPSYRAAAAIEYNLFPYIEQAKRQMTFTYFVGMSALNYREETILGELSETRPDHGLVASYDTLRPWGESGVDIELGHYLDDFDQNRVELRGSLDYRIVRGLTLNVSGEWSLVQDQIYLPGAGQSDEEVLVGASALQTDERYRLRVGLNFTFGSIYNSVLNGRIEGRGGGFHRLF